MDLNEIISNAPDGCEYYHPRLGYVKDAFGRRCKPKLYVDGIWKRIDLIKVLDIKDFRDFIYFKK